MRNAILFGNGINRSCDAISWDGLLKKIANRYYVGRGNTISPIIEYEKIANKVLAQNTGLLVDTFSYDIIKEVGNVSDDFKKIYSQFLDLSLDMILTTNYDYCIEKTLVNDFDYDKYKKYVVMPQETKASAKRHIVIKGKSIYHIHGELSKPTSICLGAVHYAFNLHKIIDLLTDKDVDENICIKKTISSNCKNTWAEAFFTCRLFIIGLGLAECDYDLWWLITYRAQLIATGEKITNEIIYYYLYEEGKRDSDFIESLRTFYIDVKEQCVDAPDKWQEAYDGIATAVAQAICDL